VRPAECYNQHPRLCTGILLFDILIGNCDRHRGNIKVDNPNKPKRIHVFDHDHALFHVEPDKGCERLEAIKDRLGITGGSVSSQHRHIFLDEANSVPHMEEWCFRIRDIPPWFIEDVCQQVRGVGVRKKEIMKASEFLTERRDTLGPLILANKHEFPRIEPLDWPVVL
jgi:hypothetical protein